MSEQFLNVRGYTVAIVRNDNQAHAFIEAPRDPAARDRLLTAVPRAQRGYDAAPPSTCESRDGRLLVHVAVWRAASPDLSDAWDEIEHAVRRVTAEGEAR